MNRTMSCRTVIGCWATSQASNHRMTRGTMACLVMLAGGALAGPVLAGGPADLLRGQAPLLFTSSEGANAASPTILRDGQLAVGDDIWLWVPALDGAGQVDLGTTGQFFKVWNSGPVGGPDGNDDDRNGMRGMDFDQTTGSFLISYEDSTTTGFGFGPIRDGALMRMTPTSVSNGFITGHTFTQLYAEGVNGIAGNMSEDDIAGISLSADGSLIWAAAGSQTMQNFGSGTTAVGSNSLLHTEGLSSPSPRLLGDAVFYEASAAGGTGPFPGMMFIGQLRGVDELATGEILLGTSGEYHNRVVDGSGNPIGLEFAFGKADIAAIDFATRVAEIVYPGELFFQTPGVGNGKILDFDILDSLGELAAFIELIGAGSDAGLALAPFAIPAPSSLALLGLGALAVTRRRRA